jgi:hypothetical protein
MRFLHNTSKRGALLYYPCRRFHAIYVVPTVTRTRNEPN